MTPKNKFNEALEKIKSFESDLWPKNIDKKETKVPPVSTNDDKTHTKILYSPNIMVNITDKCLACGA